MTETSISLLSILTGILSCIVFARIHSIYTLGFAGNCIIGVFGSILSIKLFGRLLTIAPNDIVYTNDINLLKLILNMTFSGLGGIIGLFLFYKFKRHDL